MAIFDHLPVVTWAFVLIALLTIGARIAVVLA